VTRRQDPRDQDRRIRTREVGAEHIGMRGGKMHEALTFGEKEPASGASDEQDAQDPGYYFC